MGLCRGVLSTIAVVLFIKEVFTYKTYDLESSCRRQSRATFNLGEEELSAAILEATTRTSYSIQMSCTAQLVATQQLQKVMVSLREIDLRANLDGSCKDYIQIDRPMCERMLRYDEERHFESTDNVLSFYFHTSPDGLDNKTLSGHKGFTLIFTAFWKGQEDLNGTEGLFHCANDNFIWSGLTCDGHNNCGDLSDEDPNGDSKCGGRGPTVLIILGVMIAGTMLLMCITTFVCANNEKVRTLSTRGIRSLSTRLRTMSVRLPR